MKPTLDQPPNTGAVATWPKDELHRIGSANDLHIAPFREDGVTYGTPTWIWSVAVDEALYVRGYNGTKSRWYQAAVRQNGGRIIAAGKTREVVFQPVDGPINDRIDDAYRAKYRASPYLAHPGDEAGYIVTGSVIWKVRGQPDKILKAGDSFFNPRGSVHSIVGSDEGGTVFSRGSSTRASPWSNRFADAGVMCFRVPLPFGRATIDSRNTRSPSGTAMPNFAAHSNITKR
jgi:hypothetical protein